MPLWLQTLHGTHTTINIFLLKFCIVAVKLRILSIIIGSMKVGKKGRQSYSEIIASAKDGDIT